MRCATIVSMGLMSGMAGSALACDLPKLAVIPPKAQIVGNDGPTRAAANVYFTAMQVYAACIQEEFTAAGGDSAPDLFKRILVSRNNTAIAEYGFMMKLFEANVGPADPAVAAPPAAPPTRQDSDRASIPQTEARQAGSAFAVSTTDLLTNNHVVEGCSDVTVNSSSGNSFEGRVRARDARNDLALISVGPTTLASIARFRSTGIRAGEDVIAVGFPLSGLLATELIVSKGIVNATAGLRNDTSRLQISAEVQPGNSGGPLLDSAAAVAGVVVSKLDAITLARLTGDIPQNINFAIKSELVTVFLQSQGVQPRLAPVTAETVAISDIVEAARVYTFLVECFPNPSRQ